jgi:hypothetical protein
MHDDVAEIGAIDAVRDRASGADDRAVLEHEAFEHAVRIGAPQAIGRLVAERRDAIELGQSRPVDLAVVERPFHRVTSRYFAPLE